MVAMLVVAGLFDARGGGRGCDVFLRGDERYGSDPKGAGVVSFRYVTKECRLLGYL